MKEMKRLALYMLGAMWAVCAAPLLTSCSSSDEASDEWTVNHAYINLVTEKMSVEHKWNGDIDNATVPFSICLNKPADEDVKVKINVSSENIPAANMQVSNSEVTIKKGDVESEECLISITDWSFAKNTDASTSYLIDMSITVDGGNVTLSSNRSKETFEIIKGTHCRVEAKMPEDALLETDNNEWIFTFEDGVENAKSNSVAGTGSSDVATNGVPFWVTVDLQETMQLQGIQTEHWASSYAPTKAEVYYSQDGENWISLGSVRTSGSTQRIAFASTIEARYLKYQMREVPSRVDMTAFYIFTYHESKATYVGEENNFGGVDISKTGWTLFETPKYSFGDDAATESLAIIDGDTSTGFIGYLGYNEKFGIDMGDTHEVKGISITPYDYYDSYYDYTYSYKYCGVSEFQIQVSEDKTTWTDMGTIAFSDYASTATTPQYVKFKNPTKARYVRFIPTSAFYYNSSWYFFELSEFNVYE